MRENNQTRHHMVPKVIFQSYKFEFCPTKGLFNKKLINQSENDSIHQMNYSDAKPLLYAVPLSSKTSTASAKACTLIPLSHSPAALSYVLYIAAKRDHSFAYDRLKRSVL